MLARALVRVAAAALGLRLGFEAGWWTALLWDNWGSTAQFAGEAHVEFSNIWIITGSLWGGALGLLGFQVGYRFPAGAAFLGAYLALGAVHHVGPRLTDLYWGPYPSSDFLALVWTIADLISIGVLVPTFATAAYWSARSVIVACTAAGFAVAAALGAWIGFSIQAFYYNDLEWRVLEEVLFFLLGGLGALAGRELGRWIAALRAGSLRQPSASEWRTLVAGVLLRIAIAAVGLWLGAEAGYWVALLWDEYAIATPFAYGEIALVWIGSGSAVGGALAILGYRFGHRAPIAAVFLGALLAFAVAPHLAPLEEHLYWGPFPSSDAHAELWRRSLLVTGMLAAGLGVLGYVSAGWLHRHAGAEAV